MPDPSHPQRDEMIERIGRAVDKKRSDAVSFLQQLVQTPSVTGQEEAVQQQVATYLRGAGYETDVWEPAAEDLAPYAQQVGTFTEFSGRPNVVGTLPGTGGGRSLILNAHIDTVESGDPARWMHPPFAGEIVGDRLYGRGSCDMKAGLTTILFALAAVRDAGYQTRGDVIVESVISEEDGGAGALATLLRGYRADAAIITEPTRLAVVPAQGGSLVFRLHVDGLAAHACVRNEGVSAIEKFAYLHQAMLCFEAQRNAAIDHPLYAAIPNKVPINIGSVRAGAWPSSVPEMLVGEGRAGLVPGEDLAAFRQSFIDMIAAAAAKDDWLREHPPRVEWFSGQFAPAEVPADSPLVALLQTAHQAVTGDVARLDAATYGADMRHFLLHAGIPCVMYGAGDVRVAHFTDEYVPLADMLTATKVLAVAVADWCGVADATEAAS